MALILRNQIGRKLTATELDGNFTYLESISGGTSSQGGISFPYVGTSSFIGDMDITGGLNVTYDTDFSFVSNDNYTIDATKQYTGLGWISFTYSGSFFGNVLDDGSQYSAFGLVDGVVGNPDLGVIIPNKGVVSFFASDESLVSFSLQQQDQTSVGGNVFTNLILDSTFKSGTQSGTQSEYVKYNFIMSKDEDNGTSDMTIQKTNNLGEVVGFGIGDYVNGFNMVSELSDIDSEILTIRNNQYDSVFEVKHQEINVNVPFNVTSNGLSFSTTPLNIPNVAKIYLDPFGWLTASFNGDFMGLQSNDGTSIIASGLVENGTYSLNVPLFGTQSEPFNGNLDYLISPSYSIGGGLLLSQQGQFLNGSFEVPGGYESYQTEFSYDDGDPIISWRKTNNSGEDVDMYLGYSYTGVEIRSDVSDSSAGIFGIENNNSDIVFEITHQEIKLDQQISVGGTQSWSGTYSTGAGQVVTVTNGIITDVS